MTPAQFAHALWVLSERYHETPRRKPWRRMKARWRFERAYAAWERRHA
jgi:hypothetical protein